MLMSCGLSTDTAKLIRTPPTLIACNQGGKQDEPGVRACHVRTDRCQLVDALRADRYEALIVIRSSVRLWHQSMHMPRHQRAFLAASHQRSEIAKR